MVVIPGYGMAVAQAQHKLRGNVRYSSTSAAWMCEFAIHPVAGRMPGHMNVLLAEADIPYDKLWEMDDINPEMANVDVALIIGANDVVNPGAETDPKSPIAGMPIIQAYKARTVMVIKRSMNPGFAGIDNDLYYMRQHADAVWRREVFPFEHRQRAGRCKPSGVKTRKYRANTLAHRLSAAYDAFVTKQSCQGEVDDTN